MIIKIKRIYEPFSLSDGYRILIDRLWPRGIKKEDAHVDIWIKDVAPSTALRKWFNHDTEKWRQFSIKYRAELKNSPAIEKLISNAGMNSILTLLFAAKDEGHNNAVIIHQLLAEQLSGLGLSG